MSQYNKSLENEVYLSKYSGNEVDQAVGKIMNLQYIRSITMNNNTLTITPGSGQPFSFTGGPSQFIQSITVEYGSLIIKDNSGNITTFVGGEPESYVTNIGKSSDGNTLTITQKGGENITFSNTWRPVGTGANDACAGNDPRLSDTRNPKPHTHPITDISNFVPTTWTLELEDGTIKTLKVIILEEK